MDIITDNKTKPFRYAYEVPQKVLEDSFDWLSEDDVDGFFKYRNCWYHISEFVVANTKMFGEKWQAIHSDSFFSGILLNVSSDGEEYIVARYIT